MENTWGWLMCDGFLCLPAAGQGLESPRIRRHFVNCIFYRSPSSESTTRCREQWVWRAFGSRSTSRTTTRATRGEPEALGIEQPYLVVVFTKMICSKTTVDSFGVRRSWILEPGPRRR